MIALIGTPSPFSTSDLGPVLEIIPDVVSAEWQHRHRVASDLTHCAGGGGGCFRSHRCAEVDTVTPIERLINQRRRIAAASAENDRADWDSFAFLDIRIQRRVVAHRSR